MTRETRIGLVVGLLFIIAFGLVLSELTGTASGLREPGIASGDESFDGSPVPVSDPPPTVVRRTLAAEREGIDDQSPQEQTDEGGDDHAETVVIDRTNDRERVDNTRRQTRVGATYTVRSGDTLIGISERFYGSGRHYRRILEANADRIDDPSALMVGQELLIPPAPGADTSGGVREMSLDELRAHFGAGGRQTSTGGDAPQTYTVRSGDNLTKIARRFYGDDSRDAVMKIYRANRDVLSAPDVLPLGAELKIPR
ncbi:MAG: LysM peptidoglycan-binding domain-containing protein [Phycisphaerae bacterium]